MAYPGQPTPGVQAPVEAPKPAAIGLKMPGAQPEPAGPGKATTAEFTQGQTAPGALSGMAAPVAAAPVVPRVAAPASAKIAAPANKSSGYSAWLPPGASDFPGMAMRGMSEVGAAVGIPGYKSAPAQAAQAAAPHLDEQPGRQLAQGIRDVTPATPGTAPVAVPAASAAPVAAVAKGIGVSTQPRGPARQPVDPVRDAMLEQIDNHRWAMNHNGNTSTRVTYSDDGTEHRTMTDNNLAMNHAIKGLADYDHANAETANTGPGAQMTGLIKAGPRAEALFLEGTGSQADPRQLPSNPVPGKPLYDNASYLEQAAADPEMRGYGALLASNMPINEQAARFAAHPEAGKPDSKIQQLWDAHMAAMRARPEFDQEMAQYNPGNPGQPHYDTSNPVSSAGSILSALKDGIFGVNPVTLRRQQAMHRDMGILGYDPTHIGSRNP